MTSSFDSGKRALDLAEAAKISTKPGETKFVQKVFSWLKVEPENGDVCRRIVSALERVLERNHDDSRLLMTLCFSLQEFSGLPSDEFQKKIARAIKFLEKPAATNVVKTIKNAAVADLHPRVLEIQDLDAIAVLNQAPRDRVSVVQGQAELIQVGSETINLATSGKKEIQAAVKKVKAESKKSVAEKKRAEADEPARSGATADGDEAGFTSELDEATAALANLLRSMPKDEKLSNLALVIEEAKKLLEMTRLDFFHARRDETEDSHLHS